MKPVLLVPAAALAALTVTAAPAGAGHWSDPNFIAPANVTVHRSSAPLAGPVGPALVGRVRGHHDRHDRRRHRDRDFDDGFLVGPWAYYSDYDSNRSFDPDRWNDWWHERPWRSYPRWVRQNRNCTPDRMWWSGSGWHC